LNGLSGRSHDIADRSPEIEILYPFRRRIILDIPNLGTDRKRDLFEVLVFLTFIVPSMIMPFFTSAGGNPQFSILTCSLIFNDLAYISLIAFFIWRNGEPFTNIGWKLDGMKKEAALGVGLFLPLMVCVSLIEKGFQQLGMSSHMNHLPEFLAFNGPGEILLVCILIIVVAIAEETIFRGYLMLRFSRLTGSLSASVIISSVLFSLGHGYEGLATMVTICISGMIVALIYVWRKSLVAPMVIHLLIDLYPLVLMPLSGVR
jgi:membrane protease YdiL (CAAX protease family)